MIRKTLTTLRIEVEPVGRRAVRMMSITTMNVSRMFQMSSKKAGSVIDMTRKTISTKKMPKNMRLRRLDKPGSLSLSIVVTTTEAMMSKLMMNSKSQ